MADQLESTQRPAASKKKTWTVAIAGSAAILLGAGVLMQVTRPTPAYPEDGSAAKNAQPKAAAASADAQKKAAKIVARVGKDQISYDDLAAECVDRYHKDVLDDLINRRIILQACDAQGIEVSEAEVQTEIQKTAKKFGLAVDQYLQMLEAERNISEKKYRRDIVWPMLALRKLAGEKIEVTPADVKKAFVRAYGERVRAKAIVMDNTRRAREVWEQAQQHPDDFEKLVRQHSIDRNSAAMDGVIPPIARYGGSDKLEEVAFKLKEGEISAMVQVGPSQIVILKCEGRTVPTVTDIKQVENILVEELKEEKMQMAVAETFKKLKADARVDNYISGTSTGGKVSTSSTKGPAGNVRQVGATDDDTADAPAAKSAGKPSKAPAKSKKGTPAE
ncbi:MAG: peptidylprolyl isomerase [Planctomycetes bacterium]|nr:peptidylprolyl isomerase [Planctomycetota bacterium]